MQQLTSTAPTFVSRTFTTTQIEKVKQLFYDDKMRIIDIAKLYKCSDTAVKNAIFKTGGRTKIKYVAPQKVHKPIQTEQKAETIDLAAMTDAQLFEEIRRRGYTGELRYSKIVTI